MGVTNDTQHARLEHFLLLNEDIRKIFERAPSLGMPQWYLGAGGVAQTVWNVLHEYDPQHAIKDYDLVYHDAVDNPYAGEDVFIKKGAKLFQDISAPVEIVNEARVHLWYEKHFGYNIKPYASVEDAIRTWPTTATSVGVRYSGGKLCVCAPYGLDDLLHMTVRPNKIQITQKIYEDKVQRWVKIWPKLNILPWESEEHSVA